MANARAWDALATDASAGEITAAALRTILPAGFTFPQVDSAVASHQVRFVGRQLAVWTQGLHRRILTFQVQIDPPTGDDVGLPVTGLALRWRDQWLIAFNLTAPLPYFNDGRYTYLEARMTVVQQNAGG